MPTEDDIVKDDGYSMKEVCELIGIPHEFADVDTWSSAHYSTDRIPEMKIGEHGNERLKLVHGAGGGVDIFQLNEFDDWEMVAYLNSIGTKVLLAWLGYQMQVERYAHLPFNLLEAAADPHARQGIDRDELLTHGSSSVRALGQLLHEIDQLRST